MERAEDRGALLPYGCSVIKVGVLCCVAFCFRNVQQYICYSAFAVAYLIMVKYRYIGSSFNIHHTAILVTLLF